MKRDMPEPWAAAAIAKGYTRRDGEASLRAVADAAGVSVETVRRLVWGTGTPGSSTVDAVASALDIDAVQVSKWAGVQRELNEPYVPPPEATLLTLRQRRALDEMIRAVAATAVGHDAVLAELDADLRITHAVRKRQPKTS